MKKTGIELIAEERREQIEKHGYNAEWVADNPEYYSEGQMAHVAGLLIAPDGQLIDEIQFPFGWEEDCYRMILKQRKERLIIAGALLAAEIDRLQSL